MNIFVTDPSPIISDVRKPIWGSTNGHEVARNLPSFAQVLEEGYRMV